MIDTRFSTALQMMATIAVNQASDTHTNSQLLAESLDANPSFVRKMLAPLAAAGLIEVSKGGRGGIILARSATDILISEIYKAAVPDKKIWESRDGVPCVCVVSRNIESLTDYLQTRAEDCVLKTLSEITLDDAIERLKSADRASTAQRS